MNFYLGAHHPHWLERASFPLFVSHRPLAARRRLPRARTAWALDSGGFTELSLHGRWETTPAEYVAAVRRYRDEIGNLEWAAPMDWMCEPFMLAKTGLTIPAHQAHTVANYLELRDLAPDLPFIPVLQGWGLDDYRRCASLYDLAGVDLTAEQLVGVGSVCRRQATTEIEDVVHSLASLGLRLHGFEGARAGQVRGLPGVGRFAGLELRCPTHRSAPGLPSRELRELLPLRRCLEGTGAAAARRGAVAAGAGCVARVTLRGRRAPSGTRIARPGRDSPPCGLFYT